MQLFGLNYRGIIDPTDLKWYTAILEECKSLDINDFLHDVSTYVVTRTLPPQRAASSNVSDSNRPAVVVATQDRVFPHYVPNSSIKHSKSDSKDRSQEIL
jgi:hypothetical protein